LTDAGRAQAAALAGTLAGRTFALVLTSPLQRARDTALLAGFPAAAITSDLCEWDYGAYEGRTTDEIRTEVPGWTIWTHPVPGGESAADVAARIDRVIERARAVPGDVLCFGHGHALRVFGARWCNRPVVDGQMLGLDPASLCVLGYERETPFIRHWNWSATLR
jgi:broad specificity phosphatase PhoE